MAAAGQRPKRRAKKPDGFGAEAFSEAEWPLHQFDAGTVRLTWSTCWPQPAQVVLPQTSQVTARHMMRVLSVGDGEGIAASLDPLHS